MGLAKSVCSTLLSNKLGALELLPVLMSVGGRMELQKQEYRFMGLRRKKTLCVCEKLENATKYFIKPHLSFTVARP